MESSGQTSAYRYAHFCAGRIADDDLSAERSTNFQFIKYRLYFLSALLFVLLPPVLEDIETEAMPDTKGLLGQTRVYITAHQLEHAPVPRYRGICFFFAIVYFRGEGRVSDWGYEGVVGRWLRNFKQ